MGLFILGVFVGGVVAALIINNKSKNQPTPSVPVVPEETTIRIPIEILPNLYSLELHDAVTTHHISVTSSQTFNYVTLDFRFTYNLNGRKEGKRRLIITSYNTAGQILEIKGEFKPFVFTEAGTDVMQVCFNNCDKNMPAKITVLVREGAKD